MLLRPAFAASLVSTWAACVISSGCGADAGSSAKGSGAAPKALGTSTGSAVVEGPSDPTDGGITGPTVGGGGGCPARAGAAPCPTPPSSVVAVASLSAGGPDLGYWVGCEFTSCSSATSCTTCSCVEADVGGAWECSNDDGLQPETDAQVAPYCALNSGPLDADIADVGPAEQCTPQYPTCTSPSPESPGWRCCLISSLGGITEATCMPNDSAKYAGGNSPHP